MKYWSQTNGKMKAPDKNIIGYAAIAVLVTIWLAQHGKLKRIPDAYDAASFINDLGV